MGLYTQPESLWMVENPSWSDIITEENVVVKTIKDVFTSVLALHINSSTGISIRDIYEGTFILDGQYKICQSWLCVIYTMYKDTMMRAW